MEFILGCNYWASNAGAEMWQDFDPEVIDTDLAILKEHGISYIRIFPNWRDFQPIVPQITARGKISDYVAKNSNEYYLDQDMLDKFSNFLDICDRYGIKVIVGLLTGWMSGALFVPPALYERNLITDPTAQYFEQLFIKGFVSNFKSRGAIYAWDLGNECNGMSRISSRFEAASWTAMISNAIRAEDNTRPVVSGMHGLSVEDGWTIKDQAEFTDILTTHPYPFWCKHTRIDETLSKRTTLHPTAEGKFYSDLGRRPCLAEEIGTMGPMVCSNERAASFLRINLFSLWANGSSGVMWWCSSDQTRLNTYPYTHQMVEQELGMLDNDHTPKPVLKEMKKFSDFLADAKIDLPKAKRDAVCILTKDTRHWGIAYMTYMLSKQAGINIDFTYSEDDLVDSPLYLMPSINDMTVMPKQKYEKLKKKIFEGADLYISIDNAILSEFEALTGMRVIDSCEHKKSYSTTLKGKTLCFEKIRNISLEPTTAKVLLRDNEGGALICENQYGAGRVVLVNAPLENYLVDRPDALTTNLDEIYREIFAKYTNNDPVKIDNQELFSTLHYEKNGDLYLIITNHNSTKESFEISTHGYELDRVFYGSASSVEPYDACVFKFKKV